MAVIPCLRGAFLTQAAALPTTPPLQRAGSSHQGRLKQAVGAGSAGLGGEEGQRLAVEVLGPLHIADVAAAVDDL